MIQLLKIRAPRRRAADDVKNIIRSKITDLRIRQRKHAVGNDYWNRYQAQINVLSDVKETINEQFNIK